MRAMHVRSTRRNGVSANGDSAADPSKTAADLDRSAAALRSGENDILRHHEAVAREARRFQALLAHTSDGLVLLDQNLSFIYASPTTTHLLGVGLNDILGRSADAWVHPDDRDVLMARLRQVAAAPRGFDAMQFRIFAADGEIRWLEAEASNLLGDADVAAIVGKYRDITETRQADELLSRTRDELGRLSLAIEQSADSVIVTNREGIIIYVNPAFETMTGYRRDECLGQTPRILNSGRQSAQFYQTLWATILSGSAYRGVVTNKRKDGTLYDEDQTITPIRNAKGEVTHFVSTGRDITRMRRTQEALRRLNHQFENEATRIAGVLHDEAGQFLTAAHLQLAELAHAVPESFVTKVQDVRRTLTHIEEQLRQLSHEIHPRVVEDLGLLEAIAFFAHGFMRRTGINVSVVSTLERRYPLAIETLLYRLVQEALTNISRHARATSGGVTLSGNADVVLCSVRDNGIGFDASVAEAHNTVSLGLRLIRDRLEAVGGTLVITSEPGKGTDLTARIPMEC
jgi:two-component system, NarL family, sensor histidine kinase NreB